MTDSLMKSSSDVLSAIFVALDRGKPSLGFWLLKQRLQQIEEDETNSKQLEQLLIQAVREEATDIAVYLVENSKVNVNIEDKNDALIILAANGKSGGSVDIVKSLIKSKGCNVNVKGSTGNTALMKACDNGSQEIAMALLSHPLTDVNMVGEEDNTALICAARRGLTPVVDLMMEREDLKVNTRGSNHFKGKSALIWAGEEGHVSLVSDEYHGHQREDLHHLA